MVFDPKTGNPDGTGRQAISTGGQVNVLTPAPAMLKLLNYIPLPNFGAPGQIFNNYVTTVREVSDTDQYDGRMDYNLATKHHIFGRYSLADFILEGARRIRNNGGRPYSVRLCRQLAFAQSEPGAWIHLAATPTTHCRLPVRVLSLSRSRPTRGYGTTPAHRCGTPGAEPRRHPTPPACPPSM